ncbi:hypothetical protein CCR75_007881 [Bremia lactucae]|uniref:Uncharacterized protein n=1 Tax=Bremia lactucae TaxID=4779 RepID=A0A976IEW4_BRELC|nr:hypothetical protein CCR75_007881 [Bremia lactucae]
MSTNIIDPMNMRGLVATVTSCIGGKHEKFAVRVRTKGPTNVYFVYKTMSEFIGLWGSLETLACGVQHRTHSHVITKMARKQNEEPSRLAHWIASVVDCYAFRQIIRDLQLQDKETMSTLNILLQFLVARVSSTSMDHNMLLASSVGRQLVTLVRNFLQQPVAAIYKTEAVVKTSFTTYEGRKRSFEEMRPEDSQRQQRSSLFPTHSGSERALKTQKQCGLREWVIPPAGKLGLVGGVTSRRRVFAEVDF